MGIHQEGARLLEFEKEGACLTLQGGWYPMGLVLCGTR